MGCHHRAPQCSLAGGRHRAIRIRLRLSNPRPAKCVPHLRPGRAADRGPQRASRGRPVRKTLRAGLELSRDRVSALLAGRKCRKRRPAASRLAANHITAPCLNYTIHCKRPRFDVNDRRVPLESDITTPLAYSLNDPTFATTRSAHHRPLASRPGEKAGRHLHARAVPARKNSGANGPRPLVQPDHLDGNVQRSARRSRAAQPISVLVLSLSDRPTVLAQRHAVARSAGRPAQHGRSDSDKKRRSIKWCWSATAWAV